MDTLRKGTSALQNFFLQRLLNCHGVKPKLREDGLFGNATEAAVKDFQKKNSIYADGVVDPVTWLKLGVKHYIEHAVTLFPQPTNMTCWSAAATMILGNMSVGPGKAVLSSSGGLSPDANNIEIFAKGLDWKMYYPQTWTAEGLAGIMKNTPLWAAGYGTNFMHAIVLSGIWVADTPQGTVAVIRIHDPWPVNHGSVYHEYYNGTITGWTSISLYILQPTGIWHPA